MRLAALFTLLCVAAGCGKPPAPPPTMPRTVVLLATRAAGELVERSRDLVVVDVRSPDEFADGHIKGAIDVDVHATDFEQRIGAFPRGKAYLVYDRSGASAVRALAAMDRLGFTRLYTLRYGYLGWRNAKLPTARGQGLGWDGR